MKIDNSTDKKVQDKVKNSLRNGDRIAIFGAGSGGLRVLNAIQETDLNVNVECIVDNDRQKQGSSLNGIPVKSPNELKNMKVDKVVIATSQDAANVQTNLRNEGIGSVVNVYSGI